MVKRKEQVPLIRAWMENGSPPMDDLGPIIGVYGANLVKIFAGKLEPDKKTKEILSKVLNKKMEL
jgi:hypothetical protein